MILLKTKICNTCEEVKDESEFTKNKGRCKPCRNTKRRNASQKYSPQWDKMKQCSSCSEIKKGVKYSASKESTDGLRGICKECHGHVNSKRVYGVDREKYNEMFISQEGRCKICKTEDCSKVNSAVSKFAIDHCHTTNKVRGLLCDACNKALGLFKDSPEALLRASEYIKNEGDI